MRASLFAPLVLASLALAGRGSGDRPGGATAGAAAEAVLLPRFELAVRGVTGSSARARVPVTLGKRFAVRRLLPGGEVVEVRGVLRLARKGNGGGGYVLDLDIAEAAAGGRRRHNSSFSANVREGKKHLLCLGWVRWYEATLTSTE